MTQLADLERWPAGPMQTYWSEAVTRPLSVPDFNILKSELALKLSPQWLSDPNQYFLGVRMLDPTQAELVRLQSEGTKRNLGQAMLVAHRRSEVQNRRLVQVPGLALELFSTIADEQPDRWEELRSQCRTVLSELDLTPPQPGHELWLTGE